MRIVLHAGEDIENVYKIKVFCNPNKLDQALPSTPTPYLEHRTRDGKAKLIGTQPLSNVEKILNE